MGGKDDDIEEIGYRSRILLNADFNSGKLSGKMSNFTLYDDQQKASIKAAGELAISGDVTSNGMRGNITGRLAAIEQAGAVEGKLSGVFTGGSGAIGLGHPRSRDR